MAQEFTAFTYDVNAESVTVRANLRGLNGEIIDTIVETVTLFNSEQESEEQSTD